MAAPVILEHSEEVEYLKAAGALRIPSVLVVQSWDHLTTKGVIQVVPDAILVWNEIQVEEAVRFHHVPRDRVVPTGAPVFDDWFAIRPTLDRAAFCRLAGLDSERPYVLYLCSSRTIAEDETALAEAFAREVRQNPATRHAQVLVRPYPWNVEIWRGYTSDLFTLWPREGDNPDTTAARQDYFHALCYSAAVIGINTSALIDAAIVDRPCLTVLAERYRDTQQEVSHFRYLLDAGFMEVAASLAEAVARVSEVLRGADVNRENRRRFVREFVRPWGLDVPASQIAARAVEATARRCTRPELNALLSAERPLSPAPAAARPAAVAEPAMP
jgi:hypothetical protein